MEINDLQKRSSDGIAVKNLLNSDGWKVISTELDLFKESEINKLIESESEEARANIKAISLLRKTINDVIAKGENAKRELLKGDS